MTSLNHADVRFLVISDIHYGSHNTPGDGHDTDTVLLNSAMGEFTNLLEKSEFMITLGDFPTHKLGLSPTKAAYIKTVFHRLYQANHHAKPMFYITGNNDSLLGDYQPFSWRAISPLTYATDWQGACAYCEGLLIDGTHLKDKGYYSTYVLPKNKDILLIAQNSVQFTKSPHFMSDYPNQKQDAAEQLDWFKTQLNQHHAKQLLIAMHVPPGDNYKGKPFWHEAYLKQWMDIVDKASSRYGQITILTSHTHMDEIRKIHIKSGETLYAYATPSISRIHHNNPSMKQFLLDKNLKLKDYTTFYTTLDSPWGKTQYAAIAPPNSIFPECHDKILNTCLDALSDEAVCKRLKDGLFYGSKSPRVDASVCHLTYVVR
ncbi:MAG: metallophosphoesterase [Legionellales bacterium]|nr:metallophosphoesterase [Legionellales bacterium]